MIQPRSGWSPEPDADDLRDYERERDEELHWKHREAPIPACSKCGECLDDDGHYALSPFANETLCRHCYHKEVQADSLTAFLLDTARAMHQATRVSSDALTQTIRGTNEKDC